MEKSPRSAGAGRPKGGSAAGKARITFGKFACILHEYIKWNRNAHCGGSDYKMQNFMALF